MIRFLTGGESHGPCLTVIVDGFPAGMRIDNEKINRDLARRQSGYGRNKRMQIEQDKAEILGGVIDGCTIGAPVVFRIENKDWANWQERWAKGNLEPLVVPRPGHADFAGMIKYGLDDARPVLERASARETAARVSAGAIAKLLLAEFNINIGSYVTEIGGVGSNLQKLSFDERFKLAEESEVRCPDENASLKMIEAIDKARDDGDTLGGIFEVIATGVMVGLGSYVQWDRRLDARLAMAVMSIPAIKGVEIGSAFENTYLTGTQVQDDLFPNEMGGVKRITNRAGGIEGGMTNGEPVVVRAAMKPIPTTLKPHDSVNMRNGTATQYRYQRSDFCAVPAAAIVGEAMVAWTLAEALLEKMGGDNIKEMKRA